MHIERMTDTIAVLEDWYEQKPADIDSFNLRTWRSRSAPCGSAACAIGTIASLPKFQAQGLHLRKGCPEYGESTDGIDAVARFYEITCKEARHLFLVNSYFANHEYCATNHVYGYVVPLISPQMVATRMRVFMLLKEVESSELKSAELKSAELKSAELASV